MRLISPTLWGQAVEMMGYLADEVVVDCDHCSNWEPIGCPVTWFFSDLYRVPLPWCSACAMRLR